MSDSKISPRQVVIDRVTKRSSGEGWGHDGCHLALVIEGGGMRGVVAGGMVAGLESYNLVDIFDSIHGSSAGACAGAYFLAGQARIGSRIFYEDVNNRNFIDYLNLPRLRAVMNTSYLIDYVMQHVKILDVRRILDSMPKLNVAVTEVQTGDSYVFNAFDGVDDFFSVLKASITMPIVGGHSVEIEGKRFVDGGMTQQIAINSAITGGATHIIVLLTRADGKREEERYTIEKIFGTILLRFTHGRRVANLYRRRSRLINRTLDRVYDKNVSVDDGRDVSIDYIVRPVGSTYIGRTTIDRHALMAAEAEAIDAVKSYISLGPVDEYARL